MFEFIKSDLKRKSVAFGIARKPGLLSNLKLCLELGTIAVLVYRFCFWAKSIKVPLVGFILRIISRIMHMGIMVFTGINVQPFSKIGKGFAIHNYSCVFILVKQAGDNLIVNQGVTIGNIRDSKHLPILGNNVYVGSGAKILGAVTIGDNVVVAANSLVISDVPENCTVVGVPARIISRNANSDYLKHTV